MPRQIVNILGSRFGSLVVVKLTHKRLEGSAVWECKCDCGNTSYRSQRNLRNGKTTSCGCRLWEIRHKRWPLSSRESAIYPWGHAGATPTPQVKSAHDAPKVEKVKFTSVRNIDLL